MPVTIKDIAHSLNLSHTTVSRVLNGRAEGTIPDVTQQRVFTAAREMGYRPNRLARALVTGRTNMVSLWIGELFGYHAEIVRLVQRHLKNQGYEMIISDITRHEDAQTINTGAGRFPVDGIIAVDRPERVREFAAGDLAAYTPLVSLGSYFLETVDYVAVDLYAGACAAMRHLISAGGKRVLYVTNTWADKPDDARRRAYTAMMQEAGLQPEYHVVAAQPAGWRVSGRQELASFFPQNGLPDAIFCYNDDLAIGVYRALRDFGAKAPDDVLLCGCDGLIDSELMGVPLTTIAQPIDRMCELAWQFLKQRMEDPSIPLQQVVLQPELLVRESSHR